MVMHFISSLEASLTFSSREVFPPAFSFMQAGTCSLYKDAKQRQPTITGVLIQPRFIMGGDVCIMARYSVDTSIESF